MGLIDRASNYAAYRWVFRSHAEVQAFRRLRDHSDSLSSPVALHLRGQPGALWARPGTFDAITLWDCFWKGYHREPVRLRRPRLILDLGANAGYTAADFAARHPTARVIAVELDAGNAAIGGRNLEPFGSRCEILNAAVWSEPGEVHYGGSRTHEYAVGAGAVTVAAVTIGDLLDRFGPADYVKMDIEGAEGEVFDADRSWLTHVEMLSIEVHPPADAGRIRGALETTGFYVRPHQRHPHGLVAVRH